MKGDLGAVRLFNEQDDRCRPVIKIKEAEMRPPAWPKLQVRSRTAAPEAVADLPTEFVVLAPGVESHQRACEYFLAMASSSSDTRLLTEAT